VEVECTEEGDEESDSEGDGQEDGVCTSGVEELAVETDLD